MPPVGLAVRVPGRSAPRVLRVHPAAEAVVHPVLDGFDRGAARAILRVACERADPGPAFAAAVVEVAAHTAELVADMRGQAVAGRSEERAAASDGGPERSVGDE